MINEIIASAGVLLAEAGPSNAPENNPEWGKAAPAGLFVLLAFVVVCFFLFRSMNRHIRRVPDDFSTGAMQEDTRDLIGEAKTGLPVLESVDLSTQSPPRLGTPTQLAADQKQQRAAKVREAKARAKARRTEPPKD